ncbi:TPM domain-containing protein [Candidatus Saccharibacteria bacterium oral taxon 955]|jgi:hypothetical protein|nr:TPM domain-containing protein [Candidatus Saccharibacteria bacterium oral taxon 955]QJU05672.1 TPM domain-containing protein [Candidatus Saccharibacteria bacterium oral taxon 955]
MIAMGGSLRRKVIGSMFVALVAVGLIAPSVSALAVPPAPPLDRPIVDQAEALTTEDINRLSAKINNSRSKKDYQIGVLIVPTLGEGEYIEGYSIDVARKWGIGTSGKNNGVLLLVVLKDRKVRIEVGRGLEGDLTDVESGRIIRNVIAPEFRERRYAQGIDMALDSITAQVEGRADPNEGKMGSMAEEFNPFWLACLGFILAPWLGSVLGRSKSWWAGGVIGGGFGIVIAGLMSWTLGALIGAGALAIAGLVFDYFVSKNYRSRTSRGEKPSWWAGGTHFGGGSSSGGSSGGFGGGSFGGGGFSGGGASGSW